MTASRKLDLKRFMLLAVLSLSAVGVAFSACKSSTSPDNEAERTRESQERTREG